VISQVAREQGVLHREQFWHGAHAEITKSFHFCEISDAMGNGGDVQGERERPLKHPSQGIGVCCFSKKLSSSDTERMMNAFMIVFFKFSRSEL
jgi:hypothetical protein